MKAYTYFGNGRSALAEKPEPQLQGPRDALVRVTLGSICTSDLHILHGKTLKDNVGNVFLPDVILRH